MSKEWITEPNEKYGQLESAYFSIDSAIDELKEVKDAAGIVDALKEAMLALEGLMGTTRTECETDYQEMIHEQTRDYWRAVV